MKTLIFVLVLFLTISGFAQNRYVATTGDDNATGLQGFPLKTIVKGLSVVKITDTLFIQKGIYQECIAYLSFGLGDKHVILRNGSSTVSVVITGDDFKICATAPIINDFSKVALTTQLIADPLVSIQFPDSCFYTPKTYYNTKVYTWCTKKDCPVGKIGSRVTYTIEAGRYASLISQEEAQAQAKVDLLLNRQQWANQTGTCK